jgi:acetyl-CoA synthetase
MNTLTAVDRPDREAAPSPREVHLVDELPKTVNGKIRRTELRARLRDAT